MAIRWDDFPHSEIRLKIYARLGHNAAGRSADDSLRHILQRRLADLNREDHCRFVELEGHNLVEHLRCTRDVYQEFVEKQGCRPILEAHWVVLRCAVFPTAIALLREHVVNYAKLTRIPGRDVSLLFGIPTRTCYQKFDRGITLTRPPDLHDAAAACDAELECLGELVNEHTLLWFRDIIDGGGVGRPFGGGPFAADDGVTIRNSFALCAIPDGITLPEWFTLRRKLWHQCSPWTDGLCDMFGSVQEELLSQWRVLPSDSLVRELTLQEQIAGFKPVVVPSERQLPRRLERGKDCEELAEEIETIRHKRNRGGLSIAEIQSECSSFRVWKRIDVLSTEDKDTFMHPGTWGFGYANLLLGKLYANGRRDVAPGTANTWRKEYRAYLRWQKENPSKTAENFSLELQKVKTGYRKPARSK
jgi:hypothetical protein